MVNHLITPLLQPQSCSPSQILSFWECCIDGIIQYETLWDWLFSPCIVNVLETCPSCCVSIAPFIAERYFSLFFFHFQMQPLFLLRKLPSNILKLEFGLSGDRCHDNWKQKTLNTALRRSKLLYPPCLVACCSFYFLPL